MNRLTFASLVSSLNVCLLGVVVGGKTFAQETPESEDDVLAGHSYHGEVFNEGPRQRAYLMGGTGAVSFPVTTSSELAQKFINQGVGQLHGFWDFEAERSFRQAANIDPDCGMAYWGAALANLRNLERAKGFIAEAVEQKEAVTERERMYIEAVDAYVKANKSKKKERGQAYVTALEKIVSKYPDDLEAKAFVALQIYRNRSSIPISSYHAVDALIQQVLKAEPLHPTHHFRIHLWDRHRPDEALSSAERCGQGSPSIAHMWHMPGHIYSRVKRYRDAVWQQEASARVDHAHMIRDRVVPDQIHNFAHNNEWLIRNLIHIGRVRDAVELAKNMIELPRHPKYNILTKKGSTYYGRLRLFDVLRQYELWDEMISLCDTPYLEPTGNDAEMVKRLRHLGMAFYSKGDTDQGDEQLAELEQHIAQQESDRDDAAGKAEKKATDEEKSRKEISRARSEVSKPYLKTIRTIKQAISALEGYRAVAEEDYEEGIALLRKGGSVDPLYIARVRFLAGEEDQAIRDVQKEVKSNKNEVLPLVRLVDILWQSGKRDEALKAFEQLQEISSEIDLESSPVFARLAPVAEDLGFPRDWRVARTMPKDTGDRPELDSLGPFRWRPSPAPQWKLENAQQETVTLNQFRGKPLVLIFYLGYGCLHCAEQLQAFGPATSDFESAGISMLAISSDEHADLKRSIENYDGGPLPIPLVANPKLDVFRAYRAYDDFENQPLHGTFLIDPNGLVLWQDISYEPFMDHKFLLQEAQRLLGQKRTTPSGITSLETD